jgi:putative heme-binding domain-containing protein
LYISDWYDGGVGGHAYNDPDRGRIFRLTPKGKKLERIGKPGPYSNAGDAIEGLKSPNLATQFLAREYLLAQAEKSVPPLERLQSVDSDRNVRARALWVLDRIGPSGRHLIVGQLKSDDAAFRALAVRILRRRANDHAQDLVTLASDPSAEVRREVLLALPAISHADPETALTTLVKLTATYDGGDRYQLEAIHVAAGKRKAELYARLEQSGQWSAAKLPLMALLDPKAAGEFLAERLARSESNLSEGKSLLDAAATMQSPEAARAVLKLTTNGKALPELRRMALQKLDVGLAVAWKPFAGDSQFTDSLKELLADKNFQSQVLDLARKHSIAPLGPDVLRMAMSPEQPAPVRQRAVAVISQLRPHGFSEALSGLLADKDTAVRDSALNALVDMQDIKTLRSLLTGNRYTGKVQTQTVDRLMSGSGGALVLWRMLEAKALSPSLEKEVVSRAANHPDSSVRTLYEKFIPASDRPQKLGDAVKPKEILALAGDAKRGEQVFFQSSAAQCKNCHTVHGKGSAIGPDLSQIGKKYERATLLETILDPSKAIAPEYTTYLLETERGQVFAGFLMEKTARQVVLKDSKGELVRVPAKEVSELLKTEKSIMPDVVLRDVTAQDAADLLAFLSTLTQGSQTVTSFHVLGPFNNKERDLDAPAGPEKSLANPDLNVEFQTFGGKKIRWEVVAADSSDGFPAVDTVKYDAARGFRTTAVSHYLHVYVESPSEQAVTLLIGSDDGCKVWVNGDLVHRNPVTRALGFAQDRVSAQLKTGRNVIVIKVVNGDGPGGVSLGITSDSVLQVKTE